jgi:hypothetical protein
MRRSIEPRGSALASGENSKFLQREAQLTSMRERICHTQRAAMPDESARRVHGVGSTSEDCATNWVTSITAPGVSRAVTKGAE